MTAAELRSRFIEYFVRHGHERINGGSLVPGDDPTLLFTNAGMVPFKRAFQGEVEPPAARAVTVQKCLRVSGKHNDLEEVGRTARHHTFFEMLGNFSFGDYFKADAIAYAWEFVTDELGLDPDRLWTTVHRSDDEAYDLWLERAGLPPDRVLRLGDKENFWQMGETGPCGPCSEIHYDLRPDPERGALEPEAFISAGEADRFMEIWNLVFMQFDRSGDGRDTPLPAPSIDTGAGLERIAAILQSRRTTYHTDLFIPIIEEAERQLGREYPREPDRWEDGVSFRVLADHARAVAFLLADGVFPSNEKRGYVLRRILRRAVRHAWLMGRREPVLDRLVAVVIEMMSDEYPELAARREHLLSTTRAEEERFLATIGEGFQRFDGIAPPGGAGTIAGEEAFKLYDTFGFPLDLTELMAAERGYDVDVDGFETALEAQRARSRGSGLATREDAADRVTGLTSDEEQEFVGYEMLAVETPILAHEETDGFHTFLLAKNPFYAEAGGQVSDAGRVFGDGWEVRVEVVARNERGQTLVGGPLTRGEVAEAPRSATADVDETARRDTERNHTATHLLQAALRAELGEHVHQAGSLVAPDRLRFDFSHLAPLTDEQLGAVESRINDEILANHPVRTAQRGYREALEAGAMALFGEKYGDVVRTIEVPGLSLELCGGNHVRTTGQIGLFKLTGETGVGGGIRRLEAVTGHGAYERLLEREELLGELSRRLHVPETSLVSRVQKLLADKEQLEAEAHGLRVSDTRSLVGDLVREATQEDGKHLVVRQGVRLPEGSDFGAFGDMLRAEMRSGAAIVHVTVPEENREAFLSTVTDDLIRQGVSAGKLVKISSSATGSSGGGRPHFAQGGVGDSTLVKEALEKARQSVVDVIVPSV